MTIRRGFLVAFVLAGLFPGLAACLSPVPGAAVTARAGPVPAGMARVWLLRQREPYETLSPTAVYANGAPVYQALPGSFVYRDLRPGTYDFRVDSYGRDNDQFQLVTLAPGEQVFLEVQSLRNWERGARAWARDTFYVARLTPEWADKLLGQIAGSGPG